MQYLINDEYILQSGIKGMRWGVRRFQNRDGSLTAAGKKRYNYRAFKRDLKSAENDVRRANTKLSKSEQRQKAYNRMVRKYGKQNAQKGMDKLEAKERKNKIVKTVVTTAVVAASLSKIVGDTKKTLRSVAEEAVNDAIKKTQPVNRPKDDSDAWKTKIVQNMDYVKTAKSSNGTRYLQAGKEYFLNNYTDYEVVD